MKARKQKHIGRTPIPRLTCRICHRQIEHDVIEIHYQAEHYAEYEAIMDLLSSTKGQQLVSAGLFSPLLAMMEGVMTDGEKR